MKSIHIPLLGTAAALLSMVACTTPPADEPASAAGPIAAQPVTAQPAGLSGQLLTPVHHNGQWHQLITSEQNGLSVVDAQGRVLASQAGHFSQSDVRLFSDDTGVLIAALDNNTQAIHIYRYPWSTGRFQHLVTRPAGVADVEALCLHQSDLEWQLFSVDTRGKVLQQALVQNADGYNLKPLRDFYTGPGVKACATADDAGVLYLADENVGVWAYQTFEEAEDSRTLIPAPAGLAIEGVDALKDGTLLMVSPDSPALWLVQGETRRQFTLSPDVAPEKLRGGVAGEVLMAGIYDDNSGELFTLTLDAPELQASNPPVKPEAVFKAVAETTPVARFGDAADDPAIWLNRRSPADSRILATDKKAGLNVYDLAGKQLQHLPVGRVNNVDVRHDWRWQGALTDIAVASNRNANTLDIFTISVEGAVAQAGQIRTGLSDVYGLCLYQHGEQLDVFVNDTDGRFERYRLKEQPERIAATLLDSFRAPSQPEGCVADDQRQLLFYGEEARGVWLKDLSNDTRPDQLIAEVNERVVADIEGMALFTVDEKPYLIVSSQGNNRYGVYQAEAPWSLLGTFAISADHHIGIDGVSETDGLDALAVSLGPDFPDGLLVVQDGRNVMPTDKQNFKLVSGTSLKSFIRHQR